MTTGDVHVRVAAGKQRSLLAALAVQARDVVPADTLAEAIWDAEPPRSWEVTLRNYVRRLRVLLGAATGGRIMTSPPGYLLKADNDEVDVLAFEVLRRDGLAAARGGDWPRAAVKLSQAESLWRGTPFADIPSRSVRDAHLPYLQEARLTVLQTRIDADLRLSHAKDVIPELQRLTSQYPARERFRAQLMLALYRSGRQADALAEFRSARQFSVAELGLGPGPEITDLHQRILRADEGLLLSWAGLEPGRATGALPARDLAGSGLSHRRQ
ncbi:MAG TPA: AfsR/SARP family transcriptional regulator [Trebonia sp.]|nr:AfsR/SARP family transcriptional regulator [Trebonia sp.]